MAFLLLAFGSSQAAADGAQLAMSCGGCHGRTSAAGGIPSLETVAKSNLPVILSEYKEGARQSLLMKTVAESLSEQDIAAIQSYLSEIYK
jgi:cytochrome c553